MGKQLFFMHFLLCEVYQVHSGVKNLEQCRDSKEYVSPAVDVEFHLWLINE